MSDHFDVSCPDCGESRSARREFIGRAVQCGCGARFTITDPQPSVAAAFNARNRRRWVVAVSLLSAVAGSIAGLNSMLHLAGMASFTEPAPQSRPAIKNTEPEIDRSELQITQLKRELDEQRERTARLEAASRAKVDAERRAEAQKVQQALQQQAAREKQRTLPPVRQLDAPLVIVAKPKPPENSPSVEATKPPLAGLPVAKPGDEFVPLYELETTNSRGLPYGA